MIRTHPCLPWLAVGAFLVRSTRQWRIQTVKMPTQRTVIARDHLSLAQRGTTATEAEDGVVLLVLQFQVVRNLVIARPCSRWEVSTRPEAIAVWPQATYLVILTLCSSSYSPSSPVVTPSKWSLTSAGRWNALVLRTFMFFFSSVQIPLGPFSGSSSV